MTGCTYIAVDYHFQDLGLRLFVENDELSSKRIAYYILGSVFASVLCSRYHRTIP